MESVGRDAFLEALDDPELRVHILEKGVKTMDKALCTAMSLEAVDKSKDTRKKAWRSYEDLFEDEPRRKKEKMSRFAVKSVEASKKDAPKSEPSVVTVGQLQEALANCMKEMTAMCKEFAAAKSVPSQPKRPNRPQYSQSAVGQMSNYSFRPRVPNGQVTTGYRGAGPRQPYYVPRGPGACFTCGRFGYSAQNCRINQATVTSTTTQRPSAPNGGASRVQQAVNLKELRDVYVPIQLFNRKMSPLLDRGCDASIIGARLLPAGTRVEPTLHTLKAANGTPIPVEGVIKVTFKIGAQKHSVHAVVTKAIHEMILGIDFLIDADVDWKFSQGRIKIGDEWIKLHTRKNSDDVRKVYVRDDCEIPLGCG